MKIALAFATLFLVGCTTTTADMPGLGSDAVDACGDPPTEPSYSAQVGSDVVTLPRDQWDALAAWNDAVNAWALCVLNGGS